MRLLCLSALLVAANAAHAGTVLETVSRELGPEGASSTMSTSAQGGAMRVESPGRGTRIVVEVAA